MKTYLKSRSKNLIESGVNMCSCDLSGTLVATTGWRRVDDSCQELEKGCGSSKGGGDLVLAASQPQNYISLSFIMPPLENLSLYPFLCIRNYMLSSSCTPTTLLQPPNPHPKAQTGLKNAPVFPTELISLFFAAAFCYNQNPHIKARTHFLRWGWDSSFVTWSYTHQQAASIPGTFLWKASIIYTQRHDQPCTASTINAGWFRVAECLLHFACVGKV